MKPIFMLALLLWPQPLVYASWLPSGFAIPAQPPVQLLPAGSQLLVLQARTLWVAEPQLGTLRRAFHLTAQDDGLVAISVRANRWWLASRRHVWMSEDEGYTWRSLVSLNGRDGNEWLAVVPAGELVLGASRYGIKRVEPGLATAWGLLGHERLINAALDLGLMVVATPRGLFAVTSETAAVTPVPLSGPLLAAARVDTRLFVATPAGLSSCWTTCQPMQSPRDIADLALTTQSYWATTSDAVYRMQEGEWERASEGLGRYNGGQIALLGSSPWLLTAHGLFSWSESDWVEPKGQPVHPLEDARRGPSMAHVRVMVLAELRLPSTETWLRRVRWRAVAPRLSLGYRHGADRSFGLTESNTIGLSTTENRILVGPNGTSATRKNSVAGDYSIGLTWNFDDLVFNSQELSVSNEQEDLFRLREAVLLDVTRIYYDRLRTLAELAFERDPAKRMRLEIRLDELTADLDFYTGGRFSAALQP